MATDQEIRDAGLKYIPQQKYLQNPYELPVEEETAPVNQGIVNTNSFNNSGNDFSVYNPDPNSIVNREYRPNYDYRQFSEYGSDPSTADIKQMDMNQNYFYKPPVNPKIQGLMSMIPYAGAFTKGVKFLGDQIGPYLPTNRRGIFENELAGQGIMVNDIGQIVQGEGSYDDVSGRNVMAGYNANKMTAKTFDDRIEMAKNKMSDTNIDPNTNKTYKEARIAALEAAKADFLRTQEKADKIYDFEEEEKKKNKKNTVINRFITKKKETKAAKDDAAAAAAADETSAQNYPTGGSYDAPGGVTDSNYNQAANIAGGGGGNQVINTPAGPMTARQATYDGNKNTGTNQGYSQHYSKGGRAGYFFGGRVNYKKGGRVSFKNGGLAGLL